MLSKFEVTEMLSPVEIGVVAISNFKRSYREGSEIDVTPATTDKPAPEQKLKSDPK